MPSRLLSVVAVVVFGGMAVIAGCGDDDGDVLADTRTTTTAAPDTATTTTIDDGGTTTTTVFTPPLPQTTPNVSQPDDSLLDGQHVVFLVEVDVDDRALVFDLVQWFYQPDFERAIADGRMSADDPCVEFDYCIVNADQRTRTMPVTIDARVSVVDYDDCCTFRRTDNLADALVRLDESRDIFLLTANDGEIVAVDEVYLS